MTNKHIDAMMSQNPYQGLTFDDVTLLTRYADFLPDEADVSSKFSRNITLNIPFASAAMDTVTEAPMAIAIAQMGGIGVVHKNLSAERQAAEVEKVKHYANGLIQNPVSFSPTQTVGDVLTAKENKAYPFSGFPIVDGAGTLVGILTAKDLKFASREMLVSVAMTETLITAAPGTTLNEAYELMIENKIGKLPLVDGKGKLTGLYSFHDIGVLHQDTKSEQNLDEKYQLRVAAAMSPYDYDRAQALVDAGVDALVIDTAHGHSKGVIETVKELKTKYGDSVDVVAGNVGTGEGAKALYEAGADAIKVGIGPGSICTTRVVAGVGVPQITAVYEAARAVNFQIPIIADGGIKQSGDVAKAIAVGASCVMVGSLLAATEESPGEKILHQGRRFVIYRGMGSMEAMKSGKGSRERYSQGDIEDSNKLIPQGIEGRVPFRGDASSVLHQYAGGLKFSLGYCGTRTIPELQENAILYKVSAAGLREAHPHDIQVVKDAPNYRPV